MSIYGIQNVVGSTRARSPVFSGHTGPDEKRLDQHQHAFFLPSDEDGDGHIDHLTVVARESFGPAEQRAVETLRELRFLPGDAEETSVRLRLDRMGPLSAFDDGLLGEAKTWVSATPFIAQRHVKKTGAKRDPVEVWQSIPAFLELVLREEITRLRIHRDEIADLNANDVLIAPLLDSGGNFRIGPRGLRPTQFQRFRPKQGDDGGRRLTGAFRLVFPRPVRGPIALGYSAHFGMGLFRPETAYHPDTVR